MVEGQDKIKIAVIHGRIRLSSKRANLRFLQNIVSEMVQALAERRRGGAGERVDLVVIPPYPITGPVIGYHPEPRIKSVLSSSAERIGSSTTSHSAVNQLAKIASDNGVNLLVGPMIERAGPRLYVTSTLIDRYGRITSKYRKIAVTRTEESYGINPGKDPGVFELLRGNARIGVFIDEDLAYPEVFRLLQSRGANIIIGFMLPYKSDYFKMLQDENKMITMEKKPIYDFLAVRSVETGLPIILVGGVVEHSNSSALAYMDTVPVEPEYGVIEERAKSVRDANSFIIIDVDIRHSRALPLNTRIIRIYKRGLRA